MPIDNRVDEIGLEKIIREKGELAEVIEIINKDQDQNDNRSDIDFHSRLTEDQVSAVMVVDTLKIMGVLPKELDLTRQLKRLSVSIGGRGRAETVAMTQNIREEKSNRGFLGGLFSKKE